MKRIILTGGGTAGHVTPNIALLPRLKELGYDIQYIGSYTESLRENYDAISAYRILLIHSVYLKAFVKPIN